MKFDLTETDRVLIVITLAVLVVAFFVMDHMIKRDKQKTVDQILGFIFGENLKMAKESIYNEPDELKDIHFSKGEIPYRDHNKIVVTGYKGFRPPLEYVQITIGYFEGGELRADPLSYPLYRGRSRVTDSERPD